MYLGGSIHGIAWRGFGVAVWSLTLSGLAEVELDRNTIHNCLVNKETLMHNSAE